MFSLRPDYVLVISKFKFMIVDKKIDPGSTPCSLPGGAAGYGSKLPVIPSITQPRHSEIFKVSALRCKLSPLRRSLRSRCRFTSESLTCLTSKLLPEVTEIFFPFA